MRSDAASQYPGRTIVTESPYSTEAVCKAVRDWLNVRGYTFEVRLLAHESGESSIHVAALIEKAGGLGTAFSDQHSAIARLLGIDAKIENEMDIIDLAAQGVTPETVIRLKEALGLEAEETATILSLPMEKVNRHDRHVAERVFKLAEVAFFGGELFENPVNLAKWLREPARALGGRRPLDLLSSYGGMELVARTLAALEYGVVL